MKFSQKILAICLVSSIGLFSFAWLILYWFEINPLLLLAAVLVMLLLVVYLSLRTLTDPLNKTINQLKEFNLYEEEVEFDHSTIKEIQELNAELNEFSSISKEQYLYQRQYSENLSHELLTPLAVIRTKTELILQNPNLRESDLQNLDGILQTVSRLSKVNQALILLSKINNNQFIDEEVIDLQQLINDSLENFEDQIRKKQLAVRVDLSQGSPLNSNFNLVHILIMNLVKNAVFHNIENGEINVVLTDQCLIIENTGLKSQIDVEEYFQRFVSSKKKKDSIGLGLAIVKQICSFLDFEISYEVVDINHKVNVRFK